MFGTHDLWLFVVSGLLLNITPGVDFLYVPSRSGTQGFVAGVFAALGISAGCIVHILAAALGLSALLATSAMAFTTVKWIGAAYLVYVGISMLVSKPAKVPIPPQSLRMTRTRAFSAKVFSPTC